MKKRVKRIEYDVKLLCDGCDLDMTPFMGITDSLIYPHGKPKLENDDMALCNLCADVVVRAYSNKPYKINHKFKWNCYNCEKQQTHRDLKGFQKCDLCLEKIQKEHRESFKGLNTALFKN